MIGTFTIINVNAIMLKILKLPTTIYSWKAAETKKVKSFAVLLLNPLLIKG